MGCAGSVVGIFQSSMVIDRDHFFFTKVMGSGGFGTVVSAIHIEHHSWFAIKQVDKFELSRHKNGVEMIMAELKAWKQVGTHKYVSDLHFAFQDRGYCYFVTSLLVGADLRYYIKMKIMLTEPEIAFIAGCMISALQHIHSKGVLHRDVKPENIVFDHQGFPHLTDFGVAHCCETDDMVCTLSSGTKQYLAPEVCTKSHRHSIEADFWALGIVLYELMYAKRPFEKHVPQEFIAYVAEEMERDRCGKPGHSSCNQLGTVDPKSTPSPSNGNSPRISRCFSSPALGDTSMTGAASLFSISSPMPKRHGSHSPKLGHSQSAHVVSPRQSLSPKGDPLSADACRIQDNNSLVQPPSEAPVDDNPILQSKSKKTSSVMKMLRSEESKRRNIVSSKMAAPIHPCDLQIKQHDHIKQNSQLTPKTVPIRPGTQPHLDERQDGSLSLLVDAFTEANTSIRRSSSFDGHCDGVLPEHLRVDIPLCNFYNAPVSVEFINCLQGMLDIRPSKRLGGKLSGSKLREHIWFSFTQLDWSKIEQKKAEPAFVPDLEQVKKDIDSRNMKKGIMSVESITPSNYIEVDGQHLFSWFSHISPSYQERFPGLVSSTVAPGVSVIYCPEFVKIRSSEYD